MNNIDRIYTLDAMRGVAAILVVLYHLNGFIFNVSPSGYLAVDFFFVLSGFVLANAYEAPLQKGMSAITFIRSRIIRLYPLFIMGVFLALIIEVSKVLSKDPNAPTLPAIAGSLALELFMLPSPFIVPGFFPLNGPAWSLFFELVINCVFAVLLSKLRSSWILAICGISGAILAYSVVRHGHLDIGWTWPTIWAGLARVTFSFSAGILIARQKILTRKQSGYFALPIIFLIILLIIPASGAARPLYDIASALVIFPFILILGVALPPLTSFKRICVFLGNISYPLYAIHSPVIRLVGVRAKRLAVPDFIWAPALIVFLILLAWILGKFVDPRIRRFMDRTIPKRVVDSDARP